MQMQMQMQKVQVQAAAADGAPPPSRSPSMRPAREAPGRTPGFRACASQPTVLGLFLAAAMLSSLLLLVEYVDVLAAEKKLARRAAESHPSLLRGPREPSPAARPVAAALLERTVALVGGGDLDELGVRFDMSSEMGVIVAWVDGSVAESSGLAAGDRVLSLAGIAIAADHDPLSALDEAEDLIREQRKAAAEAGEAPPPVVVVAAPSNQEVSHGVVAAPRFGGSVGRKKP